MCTHASRTHTHTYTHIRTLPHTGPKNDATDEFNGEAVSGREESQQVAVGGKQQQQGGSGGAKRAAAAAAERKRQVCVCMRVGVWECGVVRMCV
jgi:hypothetical protein